MRTSGGAFRTIALNGLVYVVSLSFLLQAYSIASEYASGSVLDPWMAFFPLVWVDIALVVLALFALGLLFGWGRTTARTGWRSWLVPDFVAIREAARIPAVRSWILGAGVAYAIILMLLQRVIAVDLAGELLPAGTQYPYSDSFGGPLGWGPKFIWAPNPYIGLLVRPYTAAVTLLLSTLAGLGIGLLVLARKGARSPSHRLRDAAGTVTGALVMCPACATSPALAVFAGALGPTASGAVVGGIALGPLAAFSTAMLVASVAMLWVGIARGSRRIERVSPDARAAPLPWRKRIGAWLVLASVVLAVGALLLDLSGVPAGGSHGHGDEEAPFVHAPAAIALGTLGAVAASVGVALRLPGGATSRRQVALVVALAALYVDGLLHWFAVAEHVGSASNITFFLATGAVQLAAVPLAARRGRLLWWVGVAFTSFLILLFAVTRVVPPPFELQPEPVETLGLLSKGVEAVLLIALFAFFGPRIVPERFARTLRGALGPLLFLIVAMTGATLLAEAEWGLISTSVFFLAVLILGLFTVSAAQAYTFQRQRLVLPTWSLAALLFIGHVDFGVYYATIALSVPFLLCVANVLSFVVAFVAAGLRSSQLRLPLRVA